MALTYNKDTRELILEGVITQSNGNQIQIAGTDIVRYSPSFEVGYEGLPLGSTSAASFTLELDNVGRKYTPSQFDGAEVHMRIGIMIDGAYEYSNFGVWYVESTSAPEQSVSVMLFGSDALASKFEGIFIDTKGAYPSTIGSLLQTVCTAAGIPLRRPVEFPNAATQIKTMPEWDEETTFRDVISYCAICAGGFARIALDGVLEIVSFADGVTYDVDAGLYHTFEPTGGSAFTFNALEVMLKKDDEDYTRYAVDANIADNATNTIQIDYNPLLTSTIVNSIVTELTGVTMSAGTLVWGGDPAVKCGDYLNVTMVNGDVMKIMVLAQSFTFDGGLSASVECSLPSTTTVNGSSYSTAGSLYDSNGRIRATRISGLDGRVITATSAHFEKLTAGEIITDKLMINLLDALKLRADQIDANSVDTDALTALVATIVEATVKKLNAGSITSDELYAAFAELVTLRAKAITAETIKTDELYAALVDVILLRAQEINAGNIETDNLAAQYAEIVSLLVENITAENVQSDRLGAVLANFVTMYAGTGEFDFATIQNLVAKAMALQQGSMDTVYIKNLAVTTANMLSATLGKLIIKGDDGKYYRVFISATGEVKTEEVQPTEDEIQSGQTSGGQQIVETNMNVGNLNATMIQGNSAVINEILTIALNAEKITAADALIASATITELYATSIKAIGDHLDLSANESVKIMVGQKNRIFRSEEPPEGAQTGDIWAQPSTGYVFQKSGDEGVLPEFYTDGEGNLYYRYSDDQTFHELTLSESGDLYLSADAGFGFTLDENGMPAFWQLVRDSGLENGIADARDDLEKKINGTYSELTQTVDSLEFAVKNKVDADELQAYMRYSDGTLELGKKGSRYTTQTSNKGFEVLQDGEVMTSMKQNTVSAPVVEARRMITVGGYSIFTGATGHLIFN